MRRSICDAVVVCLLLSAAGAVASTIPVGLGADSHAIPGWSGRAEFYASPVPSTAVDVEYAVFTSAQFALSTYSGGVNPAPGDYIYAYQVLNDLSPHPNDPINGGDGTHDAITKFSVGIEAGAQPADIDYVAGTDLPPSAESFAGSPVTTAAWYFSFSQDKQIPYGYRSDVLYFASPFAPQWNSSSLVGTVGVETLVPSPTIPEPSTLMLLALAGVCGVRRFRSRKE